LRSLMIRRYVHIFSTDTNGERIEKAFGKLTDDSICLVAPC